MIARPIVEQLAHDVCTSMLGLNLETGCPPIQPKDIETYCAHIQIEGDWQVQIFVICANGLAQKIASTMFMSEPDELSADEIGDAVGELVNMLGGNLKGVLSGDNRLSLPSVERADTQSLSQLKSDFDDVYFECEGYPLTVRFSEPIECKEPEPELSELPGTID